MTRAWFNVLVSVPFFFIALPINRRGHHDGAFSLAFVELFALGVLALLINHFSRSAHEAERKLKAEKAVTEQKNLQLSRQHEEGRRRQRRRRITTVP